MGVETEVTATNLPVPVAVGGYKAVAGDNGDLPGAVHEVPALVGAPALNTQANEGTSLTVGTSAVVTSKITGFNTAWSLESTTLARGRQRLTLPSYTLVWDTLILATLPTLPTLDTPMLAFLTLDNSVQRQLLLK